MTEGTYMPDPFLKDSWGRIGDRDRGKDDKATRGAGILSNIELDVAGDEVLKKLLEQLKKDVVRYQATIRAFKEARGNRDTKDSLDEIELKYKNENRAHQRLIADLNLLSRQFKERSLSNKWREEIGLSDEEVGRWAENLQI